MGKETKSHSANFREKARAFLRLPDCALDEVLTQIGLIGQDEKEFRAQHEAGHALIALLGGKFIEKAEIHRLRGNTCAYLNMVFGAHVFHAGEVSTDDAEDQEFAKQHPDRYAIFSLAGLAATYDAKYSPILDRMIYEHLANGADDFWEDVSVPCIYIQDRFQAIYQRQPTKDEVSRIFYALLNEIWSVFSEAKFAKVLTLIKELIKEHRLKRAVNDTIMSELFSNGLSREDLAEMQQRIVAIDIDQVMRSY